MVTGVTSDLVPGLVNLALDAMSVTASTGLEPTISTSSTAHAGKMY
jgi:hypothetical protein